MNGPFLLTSHGVDLSCALILIFMLPPFFLSRCSVTCIFFLCIYTILVMISSGLQKKKFFRVFGSSWITKLVGKVNDVDDCELLLSVSEPEDGFDSESDP